MDAELAQVGPRLRAMRQARGLTLEDLASSAGMSTSTLSRLESGKRQASLELLLPLTRRLGTRIDDLLSQQIPDPRVKRGVIHRYGLVIEPLAPEHADAQTFKITYPPHAGEDPTLRVHDGYEWFYVLSGRIRLWLGDLDLTLARGEAAEFDTRTPHAIASATSKPAQVISIGNLAGMRMHTHTYPEPEVTQS